MSTRKKVDMIALRKYESIRREEIRQMRLQNSLDRSQQLRMMRCKMEQKKLYWYVVYWRNDKFKNTKLHPMIPGTIFGLDEEREDNQRIGFLEKSKDFFVVEKYKLLFHGTQKEFDKWLQEDRT